MLARKNANASTEWKCGGENVSPPLSWSNAPEGTKSFALLMFDPEGMKGLGVSHFVAYDIPPTVTSLAEGEASAPSPKFVGGKGAPGNAVYFGPCPPEGERPHHYMFTILALDIAPGTLKPGLTREELLAAIKGHSLAAASIIGKYAR